MMSVECPCPKKCERHGHCDECRAFHKENKKNPPFCERPSKEERKALREASRAERHEQRKNR